MVVLILKIITRTINLIAGNGAYLIHEKQTRYTLIHSMNIDDSGHKVGSTKVNEYVSTATVKIECYRYQLSDGLASDKAIKCP